MCEWTNGSWPYEGSFDREKLQVAEVNVQSSVGNPSWDFAYMKECMQAWLMIARQRCGVTVSEKVGEQISDELKTLIEQSAKRVTASVLPRLETALQTRAVEIMKIKQRHAGDRESCAKAMMYNWVRRQAKIPSVCDLLSVLTEVGLSVDDREKRHVFPQTSARGRYSKLSPSTPCNREEQMKLCSCTQQLY